MVYRKDGTLHPGPRSDWSTWDRSIKTTGGFACGDRFIQMGQWRMGAVNETHFSISHQGGKTAQIYQSDGTRFSGPRSDLSTWSRPLFQGANCSDDATLAPTPAPTPSPTQLENATLEQLKDAQYAIAMSPPFHILGDV